MKRLFYLYALLILAGCTDMSVNDIYKDANEEFQAFIEDNDSRTYIDEQVRMRWTAEDRVTLFRKNTYNREYMFTGKTGANAGGFRQVSTDDDFWFGYDVAANYAIYPHSADTELDETELYITYNMPSEQTYVENSFGLGANVMVAVADDAQLMFKNVGSYLRVRLYGENVSVSSITLTSKGVEAIAGKAKITPTMDGNPTCEMIGNGQSVRLVCPTPVTISSDANNPTDFWIVVPPVTFSKGFSVTVENSDGETQVFDVEKSVTFKRNSYNNLKREVTIEKGIPNNQIWYKVASWYGKRDARPYSPSLFGDATFIKTELIDSINRTGVMYFDKEIKEINGQAFHGQDHIVSLTLPNSIETIAASAFSGCTGLCKITLPESLTAINTHLLSSTQITTIDIPENVKSIGFYAINLSSIKEVHFKSTTPPDVSGDAISRNATLYVPKGSLSTYKSTWFGVLYKIVEE